MNTQIKTVIAATLLAAQTIHAEVEKLTMGINVNCPSGLGECFHLVREGLLRVDGIGVIKEGADVPTGTAELCPKDASLLDPQILSKHIYGVQVGATLRGVEATVQGTLIKQDKELVLRVPMAADKGETNIVLRLAPIKQKVQLDPAKREAAVPNDDEKKAHAQLLAKASEKSKRVRITGPLVKSEKDELVTLEVRLFEVLQ